MDQEKIKKYYEERICENPNCKRTFYVKRKGANTRGHKPYPLREQTHKTCSKQCANMMRVLRRTRKTVTIQ